MALEKEKKSQIGATWNNYTSKYHGKWNLLGKPHATRVEANCNHTIRYLFFLGTIPTEIAENKNHYSVLNDI